MMMLVRDMPENQRLHLLFPSQQRAVLVEAARPDLRDCVKPARAGQAM